MKTPKKIIFLSLILYLYFLTGPKAYAQCDGVEIKSSAKAISCLEYESCESLDQSSDDALLSLRGYYSSIIDGFKLYAADFAIAKTTINSIRKNKTINGKKCGLPALDYKLD